jgi:Zn-dependent protease with chaperone function
LGYLLHILIALGALAAAEEGFAFAREKPLAVLALAAVPHGLAWCVRRLVLAGRFRVAEALFRATAFAPAALQAIAVLLFGWPSTVERWTGAEPQIVGWPHPAALLGLVPFGVYAWLSIDARARLSDSRMPEVARIRRFQTRMLASSIAPIAMFLVLTWTVGLDRGLRARIEYVALWGGAFALLLIALSIAFLPWLLRSTLDTSALPAGPRRTMLEDFARRIGFRCRSLVQWNTGAQMANAAVVGIGPGRMVLFSDVLLSQLGDRELLAVFAHEIGHVARRHVLVFVAWSAAYFVAIDLALGYFEIVDVWEGIALLTAALAAWYLAFGVLSRRTELEADLYSVARTGDLEAMITALERVGSPHTRALGSWRHFSTEKRVEFLRRAAAEPRVAETLTRRMGRLGRVGLVLGVLAVAAEAWSLARSLPEDRIRVALALGDDRGAEEALGRLAKPESEFARLLETSRRHSGATPVELQERAAEAASRGDLALALDLYVLAQLRGADGAEDEIEELDGQLRTGSR